MAYCKGWGVLRVNKKQIPLIDRDLQDLIVDSLKEMQDVDIENITINIYNNQDCKCDKEIRSLSVL